MRTKKHLDKIRKKAVARMKALAMERKIKKTKTITREWNIRATDNSEFVIVSAPIKEINQLKKAIPLKAEERNRYKYDDVFWATIKVQVGA